MDRICAVSFAYFFFLHCPISVARQFSVQMSGGFQEPHTKMFLIFTMISACSGANVYREHIQQNCDFYCEKLWLIKIGMHGNQHVIFVQILSKLREVQALGDSLSPKQLVVHLPENLMEKDFRCVTARCPHSSLPGHGLAPIVI